jgi:hypothetical protein
MVVDMVSMATFVLRAALLAASTASLSSALNVVLVGGTGPLGQAVAHSLTTPSPTSSTTAAALHEEVTILTRNAFLAATPSRVSSDFGWVGQAFLKRHPDVRLRDWDGGDLLDIVGQDWVGWQEDALRGADVVVHLVGGFTQQRVMAAERVVRESLVQCPDALQVTVGPLLRDLPGFSPGVTSLKESRLVECERLVQNNCRHSKCLRIEAFRLQQGCEEIVKAVDSWALAQQT